MKAAGILFLAPDNTALFLQRGPGGDHVGEWCFPGGKLEDGESLLECAVREAKEECGKIPAGERRTWVRQISAPAPVAVPGSPDLPGFIGGEEVDFTTFVQTVKEPFTPELSGEHTSYCWAPITSPPQPLHPGCAVAFERLSMDELGVAKAMRDGRLTSPQTYENVTLFAIRITGTGYAYRRAHQEYVWRDPAIYLNNEFLERCNGLQVIFDHPDGAMLTSKEFAKRTVGSIMLPYIVGNEVWGIAKIYDAAAIKLMTEEQLSTSPAVVFRDPDVNVKLELETGEKLLIEGKPSVLDHVAICKQGVWDKGGEPAGVATTGDGTLTDEERKAAEAKAKADAEAKARADAEAGNKLDQLLSGIKALNTRFDFVEARLDAVETGVKSRKDADDEKKEEARKDRFAKRKDGESDDEYKSRHDADEKEEAAEMEGKGEPKEVAADKAKKKRADAEAEEKKMADKAKADAARKDEPAENAEMAERIKKEIERKDSETKAALAALEARMPKPMTDADYSARIAAQAKADTVFHAFGDSAPRPLDGETVPAYRRRLASTLKAHSSRWGKVDLSAFADDAAFSIAEEQIYADAMDKALNPKDLPEGQLRSVVRKDSTGREITSFYGEPQAWMQSFTSRKRRLVGIRNRVH